MHKIYPMTRTKDEIVREEIVNQAQLIFRQYGLKKTTMEEIAEACGKAKSTLYHYFKNKKEVFDAVFLKELKSLRNSIQKKVNQKQTVSDKLSSYIINFHEGIIEKANIYRVLKEELKEEYIERFYLTRIIESEKQYITKLLEEGYDSFNFEGIKREDLPWLAETMIVAFMGIVRYSINSAEGFQHEKLERTAHAIIPRLFR